MRTRSSMPFFFVSSLALSAAAQATPPAQPAQPDGAPAPQSAEPRATEAPPGARGEGTLELGVSATPASDPYAIDANSELDLGSSEAAVAPNERTGFEAGLRVGATLPMGKAGRNGFGVDRDLKDLTAWRAPVWIDVGYHFSDVMTFGAYAQVGVGGNGDACEQLQASVAELGELGQLRGGDCDWSDIRLGAHAQWRLAPAAAVDPWLGLGVGYEWLSYRTVLVAAITDPASGDTQSVPLRIAERLAGPELLLQGGIDFQVDDSLRVGPYASATLGQYLGDDYDCDVQTAACPTGSSVEGSAFHSWLGVGLRGAYAP